MSKHDCSVWRRRQGRTRGAAHEWVRFVCADRDRRCEKRAVTVATGVVAATLVLLVREQQLKIVKVS